MENNTDKEMKDKLLNAEFQFDPVAWEKMEAMLDEKREPKGFFWCWFGGIAAGLFLALGIYGIHQFTNQPLTQTSSSTQKLNQLDPSNNNTETKVKSTCKISVPTTITDTSSVSNNTLRSKGNNAQNKTAKANTISTTHHYSLIKKSKTKYQYSPATVVATVAEKPLQKKTTNQKLTAPNKEALNTSLANKGTDKVSFSRNTALALNCKTIVPEAAAEKPTTLIEPVIMHSMDADKLTATSTEIDNELKKQDEDVNLKKLKKEIFNYSLGGLANITGTTLGNQKGENSTNLFAPKPSYMAGITQDFTFFKRFAITNSILFSQTSFSVIHPNSTLITSYSCAITELEIPIGVKAYAVLKPKFRFYIATGIINHIKLKETFSYTYVNNNMAMGSTLPSQTQFTGGGQQPAAFANSLTNADYYGTSDFSVNRAKRYYVSFYASAGTEFILPSHFVLFTEPLFYMALQKIGKQDKLKYNLGLSAGFRYQF